jgi:hypothetical protein
MLVAVALVTPYDLTEQGFVDYYIGPEPVAGTEASMERDVWQDLEFPQVVLC